MKIRVLSVVALAASMFVVAGCGSTQKQDASMGMVNTKCPVSGKAVSANSPTVAYKGQKVGICCAGCESTFGAMTDAQKAEKVAGAK